MIRGEEVETVEDDRGLADSSAVKREGKLKSAYGPYRARDFFKVPMNREDGPIWTFERYGSTRTELPDGRVICVGGEHEDHYDPDFHIYNDVVVFGLGGKIEIYGYPIEVFPPTDFHSATVVGDEIVVIGCLGNVKDRRPGFTPVYSVNTKKLSCCGTCYLRYGAGMDFRARCGVVGRPTHSHSWWAVGRTEERKTAIQKKQRRIFIRYQIWSLDADDEQKLAAMVH